MSAFGFAGTLHKCRSCGNGVCGVVSSSVVGASQSRYDRRRGAEEGRGRERRAFDHRDSAFR